MVNSGIFPTQSGSGAVGTFLGEIVMFAGNFSPGIAAQGQLISISNNTSLFSLLGTTYGGDGETTFALPDLRGRAPIGIGAGSGLTLRSLGEQGGTESGSLLWPDHTHIECFLSGTRILTEKGEIAVENLKIGDKVKTADGKLEPIKWIGWQTINPN